MKASRRIRTWLKDYDSRLEIHWSNVCSAWVIERKTRIKPLVLAAFKARLAISYNNTESGSEQSQAMEHMRLLARMEIEAMERGNRWQFAMPHPLNEEELQRLIVGTDQWQHGSPEQLGTDKAAKKLTDPLYAAQAEQKQKALARIKEENRYKLRDFAPHFFRRLGLRTSSPGLPKQAVV